jgi:hypothetical protein
MTATLPGRRGLLAQRRRLRHKYKSRYDELAKILYRHDPIGIAGPEDEYEPEVGRILARTRATMSVAELAGEIHAVFVKMFDARTAGPVARYRPVARDLWRLMHPD